MARITPVSPVLLDPRMRTHLGSGWTSLCTIQTFNTSASASNQLTVTGATNIAGMVDIECRMAPLVQTRPTDDLQRGGVVEEYHERRHLLMNGYFPTILQDGSMQAVVDGEVFTIRGADHDGNHFITRLKLEVVRPNG